MEGLLLVELIMILKFLYVFVGINGCDILILEI